LALQHNALVFPPPEVLRGSTHQIVQFMAYVEAAQAGGTPSNSPQPTPQTLRAEHKHVNAIEHGTEVVAGRCCALARLCIGAQAV
jgi:hypothetical protein